MRSSYNHLRTSDDGANRAGREGGFVLLATLFALLILGTAVLLVFSIVNNEQRQQLRHRQQIELRAMNDAMIAETLAELAFDQDFRGVQRRDVGAGSSESTISQISASTSAIVVTATLGPNRLTTETQVRLTASGPLVLSWQRLSHAL